jgi:hypothetical protein
VSAVRCDKCDAICSDAAVRDGWCENCGKRLPEYLLRQRVEAPAAEPEALPTGDVEFHIPFRTRLIAFLVLFGASLAAWFIPVWIVTHPSADARKRTEEIVVALGGGAMGLVVTSISLARLRAGRIVVGERELRHTRAFLGGLGPVVVTDVIPYASVVRFGFGFTPEDTDFFITPAAIPTVLLRAGGAVHRLVLKEYADAGRFLALLRARLNTPPETITPGWLGLGKFR